MLLYLILYLRNKIYFFSHTRDARQLTRRDVIIFIILEIRDIYRNRLSLIIKQQSHIFGIDKLIRILRGTKLSVVDISIYKGYL